MNPEDNFTEFKEKKLNGAYWFMRVKMRSNKNDLTFGPPCLYM